MDASNLIVAFGDELARGNGLLFCGAGLSKPSGLPLWDEILTEPRTTLGLPPTFDDLPLLAQYYINGVPGGRERLEAHIEESLRVPATPNSIHRLISLLPVSEIWTTNYDSLIEDALPNCRSFSQDTALASPAPTSRCRVYKMHGDFSTPSGHGGARIVIARDDFASYPIRYPRMWSRLCSNFNTRTILFLGLSFNDPNLHHLFSLSRLYLGGGARQHFTILKRPADSLSLSKHNHVVKDLEILGISVVEIDEYSEIDAILLSLISRSNKPCIFVGGNCDVGDIKTLNFCDALGSQLAELDVDIVSGSSVVAKQLAYSFSDALFARDRYSPDRVTFYHRTSAPGAPDIGKRCGNIIFFGNDSMEMRYAMLKRCRAAIFIGGKDGTKQEIQIAIELSIPFLPMPIDGSASGSKWTKMARRLPNLRVGSHTVSSAEFRSLSVMPYVAAATAAMLLRRLVFE